MITAARAQEEVHRNAHNVIAEGIHLKLECVYGFAAELGVGNIGAKSRLGILKAVEEERRVAQAHIIGLAQTSAPIVACESKKLGPTLVGDLGYRPAAGNP